MAPRPEGELPSAGQPIGIFDSGVGGLSVWREIVALLPREHTLYLADQAHIPYGPRSQNDIRRFSVAIASFLIGRGAKLIVVACNTASGAALHTLRATFPAIRFVGMEPAVKPAVEHTATGVVGVLATPTTFQGDLFRSLVDRFGRDVQIRTQVCAGLVEAIEAGALETPGTRQLLERCLTSLVAPDLDQLVLGCTHYPFVSPIIQEIVGPRITVIDPAPAVARQVRRVLQDTRQLNPSTSAPTHSMCTTGIPSVLQETAQRLVAHAAPVTQVTWENGGIRIA